MTRTRTRRGADGGSAAVELMLAAPVLLLAALLMVAGARHADAALEVAAAAHGAARAASLHTDPHRADDVARTQAQTALERAGLSCTDHKATVRTVGPAREEAVRVRLTCRIALADLAPLGLPGHTDLSGTSRAPIDPFRDQEETR